MQKKHDGDQVKFSDSDLGKEVCYFLNNFDVFKVASLEFQQKLVLPELLNDDFYSKKGFDYFLCNSEARQKFVLELKEVLICRMVENGFYYDKFATAACKLSQLC